MPAASRSWFSLALNKADKTAADLSIHDEIGYWGVSASQLMEQLRLLGGDIKTINLSLHSPGGEVLDGWAIYNALKMHSAEVLVTVKGLAASMASVIMLAGDKINIPKNAYVMIHRVSGGVWGDADQMKSYAETTQKLEDAIVQAYVDRSGLTEDEIRTMMASETWMSGEEAVANGFADTVLDPIKASASASWKSRFAEPPRGLFDSRRSIDPSRASNAIPQINDMTDKEIDTLVSNAVSKAFGEQKAAVETAFRDGFKTDIGAAVKAGLEEGLKDVTAKVSSLDDLTKRLETIENGIKSGVFAKAGGGAPVPGLNNGEGDPAEGTPAAPQNEAELRAAMAKAKTFAEKRALQQAFDKRGK